MEYNTAYDIRRSYASRLRTESYQHWLEGELIEMNEFRVGFSRRRKELNAALGLPETAGWDQALERVKQLVDALKPGALEGYVGGTEQEMNT